jgi:hypothetical protein
MSKVEQIENAIRALPPQERAQLVRDLPNILPELDGDAAWERIIRDSQPRPGLSALLDEAETEYRANPESCDETRFTLR